MRERSDCHDLGNNAGLVRMIQSALKTGFRHIDTAQVYGNEAEVGEGMVSRSATRHIPYANGSRSDP